MTSNNMIQEEWAKDKLKIESLLQYSFTNEKLLEEAITHCSFTNEQKIEINNNERLEFLGDAILSAVTSEFLILHFPEKSEGFLTKSRVGLVDTTACYSYALDSGISQFIRLGKGELLNGIAGRKSVLADLFEAIIGAIFLDGGFEEAKAFILPLVSARLESLGSNLEQNWKAKLQEWMQKKHKQNPSYKLLSESGPAHAKNYVCAVLLNEEILAEGEGSSKKEAEQNAAHRALETRKVTS